MRIRPIMLTAAVGVAVAATAGAVLIARHDDRPFHNGPEASATLDQIDPTRPSALGATSLGPAADVIAAPAATPEDAVRGLLDALLTGDADRSFSSLAAADRAIFGPLAGWPARLSALPHYLGYEITGSEGTVVRTTVTIEPRLDEVEGYAPGQATVEWATVEEDGGYRVSFGDSTTAPVLPSDDAATAAAQQWVSDRQRCRSATTYSGSLLGQPTLADSLCRASGSYRAGAAAGLERFRDPALLLNAFGADAATFVRVVPVEGPTPFQVALAPLGDVWEVVGVLQT